MPEATVRSDSRTLQDDHVKFSGKNAIFSFNGKSGKTHEVVFEDRRLAKLVKQCQDIPGQDLFQYYDASNKRQDIKSNHINEFLLETTGVPFTAKDFRTWGGTYLSAGHLAENEAVEALTQRKRHVSQVVKDVSKQLGNTAGRVPQLVYPPADHRGLPQRRFPRAVEPMQHRR